MDIQLASSAPFRLLLKNVKEGARDVPTQKVENWSALLQVLNQDGPLFQDLVVAPGEACPLNDQWLRRVIPLVRRALWFIIHPAAKQPVTRWDDVQQIAPVLSGDPELAEELYNWLGGLI